MGFRGKIAVLRHLEGFLRKSEESSGLNNMCDLNFKTNGIK